MFKLPVHKLVLAGLLSALVVISTILIQIPSPTKGYIHLGDSIVYLSGILLGPLAGGLAAAVGSALADLISGFGFYAPASFIIKGLDALLTAFVYICLTNKSNTFLGNIGAFSIAVLIGGAVMVGGYLLFEAFLYGLAPALLNLPFNITQAVAGAILAAPLLTALKKLGHILN